MTAIRNRGADPLAIRTHRAWQPYSYVYRTQRPTVRQLMHGSHIQDDLPKMSRLWFWTRFAIMAACTAYALLLWVIR